MNIDPRDDNWIKIALDPVQKKGKKPPTKKTRGWPGLNRIRAEAEQGSR